MLSTEIFLPTTSCHSTGLKPMCARRDRLFQRKYCSCVADHTGNDLSRIANEIDKLLGEPALRGQEDR